MEFHEKLQELRKKRGLTQEALAKELYVSRTAISKWESGRGYPGIDSLKALSKYFSVTIDELLSTEELLTAAKEENTANMQRICGLLYAVTDCMSLLLILLPLYPVSNDGAFASVSLLSYTQAALWIRCVCWSLFVLQFCMGAAGIFFCHRKAETGQRCVTGISLLLGIVTVLFLMMLRYPYASALAFLLLIGKGILLRLKPRSPQ